MATPRATQQGIPFDEPNKDAATLLASGAPNPDDTFDKDPFDGIEDIYDDLEAAGPQPPPPTRDAIIDQVGSTYPSEGEDVEVTQQGYSFFCGMDPSKEESSNKISKLWRTMMVHKYCEMNEDGTGNDEGNNHIDSGANPEVAGPIIRVMDNGEKQHEDEVEVKQISPKVYKPDDPNESYNRDTIIQHKIDQNEEGATENADEPNKPRLVKWNPKFPELPAQMQVFGSSRQQTAVDVFEEGNGDKDMQEARKIRKNYTPSFWQSMGNRKTFGVSHRIIFLVSINFFFFVLLIILISRFQRLDNKTDVDSFSSNATKTNIAEDSTLVPVPVDVKSELFLLCEEQGDTGQDGIVLRPNQALENGEYFCSPSKRYMIVMMDDLAIVDVDSSELVWSANVTGAAQMLLQEDGDLVIQDEAGEVIWSTGPVPENTGLYDLQMVFMEGDEAAIAVQQAPTSGLTLSASNFWMDGVPSFEYCEDCEKVNLAFPVRGTFYLPTYDGTELAWRDENGNRPAHFPMQGYYSSSDPEVARSHVEGMEYGNIDLAISSWEGQGTNFDRSRMTMLLEETKRQNGGLKWTVYHESEQTNRPSPEAIASDLDYLKKWFAGHDAWANIDGKPVIFVNNEGGCDVAERWTTGAAADWYVVLRRFNGFETCEFQPDSWHERRVNPFANGVDVQQGLYYNLAPGEWEPGRRRPRLDRLSAREWCNNVQNMVDSNEQWQLIVSFNDARDGTAIEPSVEWRSSSPYGSFLDCLHDPQLF